MIYKLFFVLPLAVFIFISSIFYFGLSNQDREQLPSAFLEEQSPELKLELIAGKSLPTSQDLMLPNIKIVNFWASWCGPCRAEHKNLERLSDMGYTLIGVNYKDEPRQALSFLKELGDPYKKVGSDRSGRTGIDWGIYGIPETFLVDAKGTIIMRHAGPLTDSVVERKVLPYLKESR